jgi:transcriptional regulator with XRE-family HTH domain
MRWLGYTYWTRQTLSKVERGNRRVLADEIPGLALALETSIGRLTAPVDEDGAVSLYGDGPPIPALLLRLSAVGKIPVGAIRWDGDELVLPAQDYPPAAVDVMSRMAAGTWPPSGGER